MLPSHVSSAPAGAGLYRNLWHYAAGARLKVVLVGLMLTGAALLELVSPWLAAQAINALQKNESGALLHAG
ncbi:MAG TPA: hypothetical protein VF797_00060, partial [Noviherbaspirillum sp.]